MPTVVKNPTAVAIPVTAERGKDKYSITILPRTEVVLKDGYSLSRLTRKVFPKLQVSEKLVKPKETKVEPPKNKPEPQKEISVSALEVKEPERNASETKEPESTTKLSMRPVAVVTGEEKSSSTDKRGKS